VLARILLPDIQGHWLTSQGEQILFGALPALWNS